jgi:hypothetical protein
MSVIGAVLVALAPSAQANDGPYLSVMHEQYFAHVGGIPIPKTWWGWVIFLIVGALGVLSNKFQPPARVPVFAAAAPPVRRAS